MALSLPNVSSDIWFTMATNAKRRYDSNADWSIAMVVCECAVDPAVCVCDLFVNVLIARAVRPCAIVTLWSMFTNAYGGSEKSSWLCH